MSFVNDDMIYIYIFILYSTLYFFLLSHLTLTIWGLRSRKICLHIKQDSQRWLWIWMRPTESSWRLARRRWCRLLLLFWVMVSVGPGLYRYWMTLMILCILLNLEYVYLWRLGSSLLCSLWFPLHNDRSRVEGVANRWCRRQKTRVSGHGYADFANASCTFGVVGPFGLKLFTDLRLVSATFGHLVKLAIGGHMFGSSSWRVWNLVWWVWIFMHWPMDDCKISHCYATMMCA